MTYVAFLRAINVAGHPRVRMADLERAFIAAGCTSARSVIQSGNVIFDVTPRGSAALFARIRTELLALIGDEAAVFFRTLDEIAHLSSDRVFRPFEQEPGVKLYVVFLARKPHVTPKGRVRSDAEALELIAVKDREAFVVSRRKPNSLMFGFPNAFVEAALGVPATSRNRSTLLRIVERGRTQP